ncbi:MAG: discoidin domain-containing protein [Polyangiaceae bacterium]|nr:discoidin domain-containing protein [Polyangiaceae bacterium]
MRRIGLVPALFLFFLGGCAEMAVSPTRPPAVASSPPPPSSPPDKTVAGPAEGELQSLPPVTTDNRSQLVVAAGEAVVASASSTYAGWPASNATDGNIQTSWYSGTNDSAAKGASPFFQLEFPNPATVRRVTILGNRDPQYLKGYTILSGRIELLDAQRRVLHSIVSAGTGNRRDFDVRFEQPVSGVTIVRFTSLADEGNKNPYGDVAIAEFQVE